MARQPDGDERFLLAHCTGDQRKKVFVKELAQYLGHPRAQIMRFARRTGLLHYVSLGSSHNAEPYVTEYGAQRIIAYCRVIQGALYVRGRDFHKLLERERAEDARYWARKRAKRAIEAEAQANRLALMAAVVVADPDGGATDRSLVDSARCTPHLSPGGTEQAGDADACQLPAARCQAHQPEQDA